MRLIDADAFERNLLDKGFYPVLVRRTLERQPTIEAVPVVHGEWVLEERAGVDYWCCSKCHKIRGEYYIEPRDNFCPNCGAKMDGKAV